MSRALWRPVLALHRRRSGGLHGLLQATGTTILLGTIVLWIALLWFGWWLVSLADLEAVVAASSGRSANGLERLYYVGFTIATLGTGDFVPGNASWRALTPIVSLNGLFLATLGVTYLIPVASADNDKRTLATLIHGLGDSPQEIVERAVRGGDLSGFETILTQIGASLAQHAERHLSYPVLHFLHATSRSEAAAPMIARLDEALTLFEHGVAPDDRPSPAVLALARRAVERYLEAAPQHLGADSPESPPPPSLEPLRAAELSLADRQAFERAVAGLESRRRQLRQVVLSDGWTWGDVVGDAG